MKTCPDCAARYVPTDASTVRRTPAGRRVERMVFPVTIWWTALLLIAGGLFGALYTGPFGGLEKGFGWMLIGLPLLPGLVLTIISWFFPHVRVYRCRACGGSTEVLLSGDAVPPAASD
jgi:hypothetical protein